VALAAYAASGISGGKPLMTGVNASKLAIGAFIIPYIFVMSPMILMINATAFGLIFSTVTAILGMVGVSSAMIGYLADHSKPIERVILFVGGILMIIPGVETDIPGMIILVAIMLLQRKRRTSREAAAA
ncbi:MAG: TRAP transporter permease, partial [Anaerovibrio sp.]|nr:TRAP transporter permease [Anaerovibrio sp.]